MPYPSSTLYPSESIYPGLGPGVDAITGAADQIRKRTARLNGTVNPLGVPATYYFEYVDDTQYQIDGFTSATATPASKDGDAGSGSSAVAVEAALTGLDPETVYWFRLVAENTEGSDSGDAVSFTTWPHSRVAVTREYPPDKLAVSVTSPDGVPYRWAEDEPNAENVISNLRLVDEIPGGDKEAGGTLARDPRHDWRDQQGFGEFKVYGPGGEVVWGPGRLGKVGKNRGEGLTTEPLAVGYQAALDDNRALIGPGFIDRDLGKWTGPGAQRRVNNGVNNPNQNDPQATFDSTTPALRLAVNDDWASPVTPRCEAWYDAGSGIRIGRVIADWSGDTNTAFILERYAVTDDVASSPEGSADIYTAATGRDDFSPTTPTRFLFYGWRYSSTPAGIAGSEFAVGLTNLTILADHGLTPQGTWPDIGFTAAQMLEYAIPLYTDLELGEIEDDGFVIPQAWFSDPGPMSQVVAELTRYGLYDWLVFGRKFELRAPGTYGRTWLARASECGFTEEGEDTERLWESIVVSYSDVDGSTRTVGPPGSGATVEDESLRIVDPDHPAVKAGVTRRDVLQLQGSATSGLAIAVGQRWLEDANLLSRSGQAKLSGYALDDRGVMRPVSQLRGGDLVRFVDLPDSSSRRVVRRAYEHDPRSAAVDLDAPSGGLAALIERLQVKIGRLGVA